MSHIEEHTVLEGFLVLLGKLNEDAAGEDKEEAEAEEEASTDLLRVAAVEEPVDAEEDGVADSLVELSRMSGQHIHLFKDKGPRHIGLPTDDFGVHKIAQSYGAGTDGRDDGNIVQDMQKAQFHVLGVEPKGKHQAKRATVAGQSLVACKFPALTRNLAHGKQHLDGVGEVVARLVEEAMPQSGTYEYAEEAVHEHRFELFLAYFLLPVEPVHEQIHAHQSDGPAQRVPAYGKEAQVKGNHIGVPGYV